MFVVFVSGVIRIVGELGERGNIELRLQESDSPVRITPNSKNLTLTRKLDKEVSQNYTVSTNRHETRDASIHPHGRAH